MENRKNLEDFLNQFPWEKELNVHKLNLNKEKKLNFLWKFELNVLPEELWDYLADTSTTNKKLGLPPMEFKEVNGKLLGKTKNVGLAVEWEEVPWQWEFPKFIKNERIYFKGFAKYVRAMYLLKRVNNHTELSIYFGWIPKSKWGEILLKIAMPKIQQKYKNYLLELEKIIKNKTINLDLRILNEDEKKQILNNIQKKYQQINDDFLNLYFPKIWNYLLDQSNNFLYRIKIKKVAKDLELDLYEVIKFFLKSTKEGIFILSYDIICPHCRGVRNELKNLGEIPEISNCEVCQIDFYSTNLNSIEVTFKIHPSILKVQQEFYCAAEPAKKPHIILQKRIEPKSNYQFNINFIKEIYRLRWKGQKKYILLKYNTEGKEELIINQFFTEDQLIELKQNSQITIFNESEEVKEIILEYFTEDELYLRPSELFNVQDFRDLFSEQVLNTNIKLDIGIQYLMLIDVVGSTKLYIEKGDDFAFYKIKKFFEVAYSLIKNFKGAIVKTMGDAIFASLPDEDSLLSCAKEILKTFKNEDIHIRIVLNSGKVFAVNLNTGIDYFGTPVNLLAKMEKYLNSQQIAVPEHIYKKDPNKHYFNDLEYIGLESIPLKKDDYFIFYIFEKS
jgi:hypothetical protein